MSKITFEYLGEHPFTAKGRLITKDKVFTDFEADDNEYNKIKDGESNGFFKVYADEKAPLTEPIKSNTDSTDKTEDSTDKTEDSTDKTEDSTDKTEDSTEEAPAEEASKTKKTKSK